MLEKIVINQQQVFAPMVQLNVCQFVRYDELYLHLG
jgi:hypothetical protein